ncbi:MAG: hypothetical protein O9972_34985 [Burkholderiales bacterium]|jgi:hypothetical protein|nr:hypothetical protein [Burkholderiales bacterium]
MPPRARPDGLPTAASPLRALRTSKPIRSLTRTPRNDCALAGACAAVVRSVRCIAPSRVVCWAFATDAYASRIAAGSAVALRSMRCAMTVPRVELGRERLAATAAFG